ncbi:MAG: hypothetical protein AAF333_12020 [Planctomycetota bacterium]
MNKTHPAYWPVLAVVAALCVGSAGWPAAAQDAAGAAGASVPIDLRPKWTAGQTARYEFWNLIEQTVDTQFGERSRSQSTDTEITGEITWTVDRVADDGTADCTMRLDWMLFEITSSADGKSETQVVDSRRSPSAELKPMHDLISAMAAVPVKVKVAPDGHVLEVAGMDAMKKKTDNPDSVPSELDFIETASDLASIPYAPTPGTAGGLAIGKTWKADYRWDHEMGETDQRWSYTLDRLEDIGGVAVAVVTGEGKIKLDPELPDRPADAPPVDVKMLKGRASNEVLFDLSRHEAVGRNSTAEEEIRVSVAFPDGRKFVRTVTETTRSQTLRISEE